MRHRSPRRVRAGRLEERVLEEVVHREVARPHALRRGHGCTRASAGSRAPVAASATITAAAPSVSRQLSKSRNGSEMKRELAWSSSVIGSRIIAIGLLRACLRRAHRDPAEVPRRVAALVQEAAREHRHLIDGPHEAVRREEGRLVALGLRLVALARRAGPRPAARAAVARPVDQDAARHAGRDRGGRVADDAAAARRRRSRPRRTSAGWERPGCARWRSRT